METRECDECAARMTEARHREYGKASKRMDRRLRKIVESELDALRHDPRRGSKPERNLAGMRSIRIGGFSCRTVHKVDRAACRIAAYRIGHKGASHDDMVRRRQMQAWAFWLRVARAPQSENDRNGRG